MQKFAILLSLLSLGYNYLLHSALKSESNKFAITFSFCYHHFWGILCAKRKIKGKK